jgi:uncharacterized protein (DUF3084 family)
MTQDELLEQAKARMQDALKQTQEQTQEAATQLGGLLRFGAKKLKEAADAAQQAIQDDLNSRP